MIFAFDTETFPIRPGLQAPRVVCVQSLSDDMEPRIELRDPGLDRLEAALDDPGTVLVGHNVAFDALATSATRPRLLRKWFRAYADDRVRCTEIREKLIRIAQGTAGTFQAHGLVDCLNRHKIPHDFRDSDKRAGDPDSWRTRYAELDGIPPEAWPHEARRYALADLAVRALFESQATRYPAEWLADECRQARADFWLSLQSAHGMRTDPRAVAAFQRKVEAENEALRRELIAAGLVRLNGKRDTKAAAARMREVCRAKGLPIPITKTGEEKVQAGALSREEAAEEYTALDADSCAATADPVLVKYARFGSVKTLRSRAERLRIAGSLPIQPRFDVLKETGRTSCSKGEMKPGRPLMAFGDQTQNLNREPGLRECYRARDGYVLVSVDWSAAELHTLAQVCIWLGLDSALARYLNDRIDVHLNFGCAMNGWPYEWAKAALKGAYGAEVKAEVKAARQGGKAANFGFPGGLGPTKFRLYAAKTYGLDLSESEARAQREWWFRLYPEMHGYFAHINGLLEAEAPLVHFKSGRYRGSIRYTSAANSYFQGLAADMAKAAGFEFARQCYVDPSSVLYGCRPWNFVHDEILAEVPEERAHECAMALVAIMEDAGREWCPDVPVRAEPAICRSWRKGAEPTYRDGRLIPWEDREMTADERERIQKALASGADPIHVSWEFGFTEDRIIREAA